MSNEEKVKVINEITDLGYSALNYLEQAKLLNLPEIATALALLKSGIAGDFNPNENISLDSVIKIKTGLSQICTYLGPDPSKAKVVGPLNQILSQINEKISQLETQKSAQTLSRLSKKFAAILSK